MKRKRTVCQRDWREYLRSIVGPECPTDVLRRLTQDNEDLRDQLKRHRKRSCELEELLAFERQMVVHLRWRLAEAGAAAGPASSAARREPRASVAGVAASTGAKAGAV